MGTPTVGESAQPLTHKGKWELIAQEQGGSGVGKSPRGDIRGTEGQSKPTWRILAEGRQGRLTAPGWWWW